MRSVRVYLDDRVLDIQVRRDIADPRARSLYVSIELESPDGAFWQVDALFVGRWPFESNTHFFARAERRGWKRARKMVEVLINRAQVEGLNEVFQGAWAELKIPEEL